MLQRVEHVPSAGLTVLLTTDVYQAGRFVTAQTTAGTALTRYQISVWRVILWATLPATPVTSVLEPG